MSCSEISARNGRCFNRKLNNNILLVAILTTSLFRKSKFNFY